MVLKPLGHWALTAVFLALAGCATAPGLAPRQTAALNDVAALEADLSSIQPPRHPAFEPSNVTSGNSAKLYVSPAETLPAVLELVGSAQRSVYIEVFNFGTTYADRLLPLLLQKARAGVEVKLLIDYVGSRFLKGYGDTLERLRKGGVVVEVFKPSVFVDAANNRTFNITHRKVFLADGTRALVGGVNLAGPFDTTTQDLLIEWRGPVLGPLYTEFGRDWAVVSQKPLRQQPDLTPQGRIDAQVLVTSPREGRYEIRDGFFKAIDESRREILIEQQYFWDDAFMKHLHGAVKRGVKLKVIVPGGEQKVIQKTCNANELRALIKEGAEAHRYHGDPEDAHLHTKYMAVDDAIVFTGSCNGDTRSLLDNQELDIVSTNPGLIRELRSRLFEKDWQHHSQSFTPQPAPWYVKPLHSLLDAFDYYL